MSLTNHMLKRCSLAVCKQLKSSSNQNLILNSNKYFLIQNQDVRNAGHSKWQNIRHTKASKDGEKSKLYNRYSIQITKAALKGADPKLNKELANVLELCRRDNVSKDLVDRAIKRASTQKLEVKSRGFIGPSDIVGIADFLYDTRFNKPSTFLKSVFRAYKDFNFVDVKNVLRHFEKKGILCISKYDLNQNPVSFERIEEIAIEAEAEEIELNSEEDKVIPPLPEDLTEEDGKRKQTKKDANSSEENINLEDPAFIWKLIISEEDLYLAKGKIEKQYPDIVIKAHTIEYVAKEMVDLNEKDSERFNKFVQDLSEIEEFENMYTNVNDRLTSDEHQMKNQM